MKAATGPTFLIYSKPQCTYCDQAKALMVSKGIAFAEVDIVMSPPQREIMFARVEEASGAAPRTMPQIFKTDGTYIGGFAELKAHLNA